MTAEAIAGDQAKVSVHVRVPQAVAFRAFTEEIDQWWRRGLKYRVGRKGAGILHLEAGVGGRLFESFEDGRVVQTGGVTVWEPPSRLVFEWRAVNFQPSEKTEVEVRFEARATGTLVTVIHRGWAKIRPDHPARHHLDVVPFLRMMGLWWGDLMSSFREHLARLAPDEGRE